VLLAVLPLLMLSYRWLRRLTGGLSADEPPKPTTPTPPTVPPAGRERLTPDGPRYRLRPPFPDGLALLGCSWGVALFNLGLVGPFVVVGYVGERLKWPDEWLFKLFGLGWIVIFPTLFILLLCTVIGLARLSWALTHRRRRGPAATLELTAHPLRPGQRCALHLTQPGNGAYDSLHVRLICVEEVKIRAVQQPRTETRRVRSIELFRRDAPVLQPDLPLAAAIDLVVPTDVMHSFQSTSHQIYWQLVVDLRPEGGASNEQVFPLIIYPPEVEGEST
jgi:hypothetical protein